MPPSASSPSSWAMPTVVPTPFSMAFSRTTSSGPSSDCSASVGWTMLQRNPSTTMPLLSRAEHTAWRTFPQTTWSQGACTGTALAPPGLPPSEEAFLPPCSPTAPQQEGERGQGCGMVRPGGRGFRSCPPAVVVGTRRREEKRKHHVLVLLPHPSHLLPLRPGAFADA